MCQRQEGRPAVRMSEKDDGGLFQRHREDEGTGVDGFWEKEL